LRKTDSSNPADWMYFAKSDLEAVSVLGAQKMCYELCRSRMAEALEKLLKAELIRRGWFLVRTHDLVKLADDLRCYDAELADYILPECEALAEAYFAERYPGFDLDDPDWIDFLSQLAVIQEFALKIERNIKKSSE